MYALFIWSRPKCMLDGDVYWKQGMLWDRLILIVLRERGVNPTLILMQALHSLYIFHYNASSYPPISPNNRLDPTVTTKQFFFQLHDHTIYILVHFSFGASTTCPESSLFFYAGFELGFVFVSFNLYMYLCVRYCCLRALQIYCFPIVYLKTIGSSCFNIIIYMSIINSRRHPMDTALRPKLEYGSWL